MGFTPMLLSEYLFTHVFSFLFYRGMINTMYMYSVVYLLKLPRVLSSWMMSSW